MEETNLKVRLVGAIVLVSLAVIFIPMVLDGREVTEKLITESNIPPKPERDFVSRVIPLTPAVAVKQEPDTAPQVKAGLAAAKVADAKSATAELAADKPESKQKVVKPKEKPQTLAAVVDKTTTDTRIGLSAWAVQVGSFSSKQNAYALRDNLRGKGFAAFVDTIYEKDTPSFRVRVGPELKRELAEKVQQKLSGHYKGRTFIVKHPS